ncbi:hypothetical protein IMZ08_04810 [Bacillus luteolus]|uniref:SCP2 domain-containing protein n=1 Tax=Litchfieldia luteola TaxID=682179 RepID=A0ABR9QFW3_9BACI|nr:hypothetical protein [Cytobacillus luteolus]MBE4907382.1 hypothetical protein [Cytobacillus luteolus]MBP1944147.1 hypothetical protein [Cytobacillus luteolus]
MGLEKLLTHFLERLYGLEHVVLLLPKEPLVIKFEITSMENAYLYLSSTRSSVTNGLEEHITIKGNGITDVINGTSKLTDLIYHENIEVIGSLRNILLIESIFYLSHDKEMRKIG